MAKVGIVSDSNCDLPVEVIKKYDITTVSAKIIFGDEEVRRQYVDLTYEEFYHRIVHDKEMPTTSVPSPKDYMEAYKEALKKYDEIIVFCTSSKLSNMYNTAVMVAKEYFDEKVLVIDTKYATLPMGIIVLEIAKKAAEGISRDELVKYVNDYLMQKTHAFGGIPTLTYLQKGGRIGKLTSVIGNLMHVKPIISIENGEIANIGKVRGIKNIYKLLLNFAEKTLQEQTLNSIIVGHSANLETAERLAKEIQKLPNSPKKIEIIEIGPGVGTHLGPGGLFIAWIGEFNKDLLDL
ncbi:MAG TPA: DegV family protein [Candidatus Bathyarchaeia archaeon]|nr:DegV family protein [Candidatus Bathyarchaeia archaeon]